MPMISDMGMGHAMKIPKDELKGMRHVPPGVNSYEFILSTTGMQVVQERAPRNSEPIRIFIPLEVVTAMRDWLGGKP